MHQMEGGCLQAQCCSVGPSTRAVAPCMAAAGRAAHSAGSGEACRQPHALKGHQASLGGGQASSGGSCPPEAAGCCLLLEGLFEASPLLPPGAQPSSASGAARAGTDLCAAAAKGL